MNDMISSWQDLQARAATIVERINADAPLAVAAGTNPVLAVEHLGFIIDAEARPAIADRLRLGPDVSELLAGLRNEIARIAGRRVDPDNRDDVRRLLDEMGISTTVVGAAASAAAFTVPSGPDTAPPRWRPGGVGPDPLRDLHDRHPVMGPLLDYRALSARAPQFAPQRVFEAVLAGELRPKVTAVTGRLQRDNRRSWTA